MGKRSSGECCRKRDPGERCRSEGRVDGEEVRIVIRKTLQMRDDDTTGENVQGIE